jgi:hypothetical protein
VEDVDAPYFTIAPDRFGGGAYWAALARLTTGHDDHAQPYMVGEQEHLHRYRWVCGRCAAVLAVVDVLGGDMN